MASNMFDDTFIGTVIKIDKTTREVAVFIPKLMASLNDGEATEYKVPTNNGLEIESTNTNISSTVMKTNYIWAKPHSWTDPLPKPGSKVFIEFLDDRPSQPKWSECNYNGDYEVIDEEKYPKQHDVTINDVTLPINQDDVLDIKLPSYFRVTSESGDEDKIPTFHVLENYEFYKNDNIETAISNLQKSMQYLENKYNDTFIINLEAIEFNAPYNSTGYPTLPSSFNGPDALSVEDQALDLDTDTLTLEVLKREILSNLDAILPQVDTLYPLLYRREITNRINGTKSTIETLEEPTVVKYWQIIRQFYTWLSEYNFTLGGFLTNSFSKIQQKAKTQIKLSQNLLDSSEIYTQYNHLLLGLKDTYTLYNTYISKYNLLSQAVKDSLVPQHITEDYINNNIVVAFARGYDSVDKNNITSYIEFIKSLFPTQVNINYLYSNNGLVEENHIVETNKLFELNDSTVYVPVIENPDYENDNTLPQYVEDEILPIDIEEPDATLVYDSTIIDWVTKDENNNDISIYDNYYLVKDITVKPILLFAAVVVNDDTISLYTYTNTEEDNPNITYTLDGSSAAIEDINDTITNMNNDSYIIEVIYTYNNNTYTATLNYSGESVINNITSLLQSEYDNVNDNEEEIYNKYLEYEAYITEHSITKTNEYNTVVHNIQVMYGSAISAIIRGYLDGVPSDVTSETINEYADIVLNAKLLYDQYSDNANIILDLTNDEKALLNQYVTMLNAE